MLRSTQKLRLPITGLALPLLASSGCSYLPRSALSLSGPESAETAPPTVDEGGAAISAFEEFPLPETRIVSAADPSSVHFGRETATQEPLVEEEKPAVDSAPSGAPSPIESPLLARTLPEAEAAPAVSDAAEPRDAETMDTETMETETSALATEDDDVWDIDVPGSALSATIDAPQSATLGSARANAFVYWQMPRDEVTHYLVSFGPQPDDLVNEIEIAVEELDVVEDQVQGKLYRFDLLRDTPAPPQSVLYFQVQAANKGSLSVRTPLFKTTAMLSENAL